MPPQIVLNNAGTGWGGEVENFPEKGWDKVMDLNVKNIPLHRWGRDSDIMGIALLFASQAGAFITQAKS